jgi:hypothetical protein
MKSTASALAWTRIDFPITWTINPSMTPSARRSKLTLAWRFLLRSGHQA